MWNINTYTCLFSKTIFKTIIFTADTQSSSIISQSSNSLHSRTPTPNFNVLNILNYDEEFNEKSVNVTNTNTKENSLNATNILKTKEHSITDFEEHASCSKKPKIMHTENDIMSKEVRLKLFFIYAYLLFVSFTYYIVTLNFCY